MLGMHGTAYANFAVSECNLLIAVGTRFDDRVTGKLDFFACLAKIIDITLIGNLKRLLQEIINFHKWNWEKYQIPSKRLVWLDCIQEWRKSYPLIISKIIEKLSPQQVINSIGKKYPMAIYITDVGQHQMWSQTLIF